MTKMRAKTMTSTTQQVMSPSTTQKNDTGGREPLETFREPGTPKTLHCSQCSYSTTIATNFKRHYYIHTGERPYSCPYCPYRCNQKTNLQVHVRQHTGEKPYACFYCSYRTGRRSNFTSHLHTHRRRKV